MAQFIIINDTSEEAVAGDIRVYDSPRSALQSLESYDVEDECIHIYDEEGCILNLDQTEDKTLAFNVSGSKFNGLKDVLLEHAISIKLKTKTDNSSADIAAQIFAYNPNPYT